ncbi:MAG: UDP-N-acetylmuramoyl-tripeptide--D-alanyl-D-alanine ligase [Rhodobacteraceae bacterium]|nr:UDP-N-acetylmuramoyl-tripeptide--D-alanyl-D-alanine ligase [Paracoccaceae bacterium]
MALWTSADIAAVTGGRATRSFAVSGLSIDSREIAPGDLFVALTAARDGHDFAADALARGAAGALVSRVPEGLAEDPLVIVPAVQPALEALGRAGRARARARVVGITGSVGKTSTKEMLRAVLGGQGSVHAAEKSFNNHWGVPLTLARLPAEADFAVVEIGMNAPGEIAPLARMAALDVAVITTVAPAHLAAFDSVAGIAHEKASILEGLRPGGVAILNRDIETWPILKAKAEAVGARIVTFGESAGADWRLVSAELAGDMTVVRARSPRGEVLVRVMSSGRHFGLNALAVLAVAEAFGLDPAVAACDMGLWRPVAGRGMRERLVMDVVDDHLTFDLFDDAYNANPASVAAALDMLAAAAPRDGVGRIGRGRRIAILGDMLELGPTERELHAALARHPAMASVALVHCVGPLMRALHEALPASQRGEWHETAEGLAARAHTLIDAGDVVLVKGSKASRVSLVVEAIRRLGHPAQNEG